MRASLGLGLVAALTVIGCDAGRAPQAGAGSALGATAAAAIQDSVRAFAADVAQGVTARGPAAWRGYFADEPAFFMASAGQLAFPSYDSASRGITGLTQSIVRIELRWGDSVRVDPLAPGLAVLAAPWHETLTDARGHRVNQDGFFTGVAEHRSAGWQFRNAHWSVVMAPSAIP